MRSSSIFLSSEWFLSNFPSLKGAEYHPAISHVYAGLTSGLLVWPPASPTLTKSLRLCTESPCYIWQDLWLTPDLSFALRVSWPLPLLYKSQLATQVQEIPIGQKEYSYHIILHPLNIYFSNIHLFKSSLIFYKVLAFLIKKTLCIF